MAAVPFTAGRIIGETADMTRFRSEAAFARYAGLAPDAELVGFNAGRMRSYRGGNRQLNAAIHQIAMTQIKQGRTLGKLLPSPARRT